MGDFISAPAERCHKILSRRWATPSPSCPHSLQVHMTRIGPPVPWPAAACLHFEVRNQLHINAMHPPRIETADVEHGAPLVIDVVLVVNVINKNSSITIV